MKRKFLILLLCLLGGHVAFAAVAIRNFTPTGAQVTRIDTAGNRIDAHDGHITKFGSTYYWYGTSYACGYEFQTNPTIFCGFKYYSSTDLIHWHPGGFMFDATGATWQTRCATGTYGGCFRPHVIYNASTGKYVFWFLALERAADSNGPSDFYVMTADAPTGPWTLQARPTMAVNNSVTTGDLTNGDFTLFVDEDGTAYIVYTDIYHAGANDEVLVIEQLDSTYLSGSGTYRYIAESEIHREAPTMFRKGISYYLIYSAMCGYCSVTAAYYRKTTDPMGSWGNATEISTDSCGGQTQHVLPFDSSTFIYISDLWQGGSPGDANQQDANFFWGPLSFDGSNNLQTISCVAGFSLDLTPEAQLRLNAGVKLNGTLKVTGVTQ